MITRTRTPPLAHHDYETVDSEAYDEEAITERYPGPFPDALAATLETDASIDTPNPSVARVLPHHAPAPRQKNRRKRASRAP